MFNKRKNFFEKALMVMQVNKHNTSEENAEMLWIQLIKNNISECVLGVDQDGNWVVQKSGSLHIIKNQKDFMYCMNFLEIPLTDIKKSISIHIEKMNEFIEIEDIFPFIEIIEFVFSCSKSEYWMNLSLNWFDELDIRHKQFLKPILDKLVNDKSVFQKITHRIHRELKKLD